MQIIISQTSPESSYLSWSLKPVLKQLIWWSKCCVILRGNGRQLQSTSTTIIEYWNIDFLRMSKYQSCQKQSSKQFLPNSPKGLSWTLKNRTKSWTFSEPLRKNSNKLEGMKQMRIILTNNTKWGNPNYWCSKGLSPSQVTILMIWIPSLNSWRRKEKEKAKNKGFLVCKSEISITPIVTLKRKWVFPSRSLFETTTNHSKKMIGGQEIKSERKCLCILSTHREIAGKGENWTNSHIVSNRQLTKFLCQIFPTSSRIVMLEGTQVFQNRSRWWVTLFINFDIYHFFFLCSEWQIEHWHKYKIMLIIRRSLS